jgi:hypothetical protein
MFLMRIQIVLFKQVPEAGVSDSNSGIVIIAVFFTSDDITSDSWSDHKSDCQFSKQCLDKVARLLLVTSSIDQLLIDGLPFLR